MADRNLRIRMLFDAAEKVTGKLKAIGIGSRATAADIKLTRDRLKELDRAQADLSGFRKLKTDMKSTGAALDAAQTKVAELARQMAATDTPTKKLATAFDKAKREAATLKNELNGQSAELQQLRGRLADAGINTSRLAEHERKLRTEISRTNQELAEQTRRFREADDRRARFAQGRENFDRIQGRAAGLAAGGASAIGTGVALGTPIVGSVDAAMDYQSVMTDIAQKAALSREEARKMGLGLVAASKAANQLPTDLQAGVDVLGGKGMDPRIAVKMMTPIGRAATAYKAEIADLSAAAFAANDNLKVPIDQTARLFDVLAQAGKEGSFEIRDMATHFPALTGAYQALGQTGIDAAGDMAAALQIATKTAGSSDQAATNIGNLLQKLASPQTIRAFKKFGVDLPAALQRAYKEGKTPIEAIAELTDKTLKGDLSRLGFLFEDAQVQNGLRPLIQNIDEYRRIRAAALSADGVVDTDFADRLQDGAEQAKKFRINSQALGLTMGSLLLPTANKLLEKGSQLAAAFGAWADRHPTLAKWLGIIAGGMAALMITGGALAIVVAGLLAPYAALVFMSGLLGTSVLGLGLKLLWPLKIIPLLLKGVWMLVGGIARAGMFLLANPMIAGILLLVAAVAFAGYMIWKHWDTIKGAFGAGLAFLAGLVSRFTQFGAQLIQGLINGITGRLAALKSTIVNAASSAANWFKNKLGIRSPSRVFMGFGGFMMEGLDRGIAGGERAPVRRLDSLSRQMAAALAVGAASPVLAAGAGGAAAPAPSFASGAAAGINATFNIYGVPGQSEEELARQIEEVLRRLQREQAARGRSSMADAPDWR